MSLAGFQNALAAMVMDASFAEAVRADPALALANFDLSARELERLAGISMQPGLRIGTFFHHSFRMTKIAYTLPRTKEKLGEKSGRCSPSIGISILISTSTSNREARRFAGWILRRTESEELKKIVQEELNLLDEILKTKKAEAGVVYESSTSFDFILAFKRMRVECSRAGAGHRAVTRFAGGEEWYTPPACNEHVKSPTEKWVRKVMRPSMEVYPAGKPNGTALVVAPRGGFTILAIEHEGREVARWLNEHGVTAFVLRYRVELENRQVSQNAAVEDGLLAVRTVRSRAADCKLDPKRTGVMGFSEGGYLTVGTATQYLRESRPDFEISIYAVAPEGYTVAADAPPLFIAVAYDDTATGRLDNWNKASVPLNCTCLPMGAMGLA